MGERHLVSSVNNSGMDCDTHSGRSLINSRGPRGNSREDRQYRGVGTVDGYVLDSIVKVLTEPLP